MSGWHFEQMAADCAAARPAYPVELFVAGRGLTKDLPVREERPTMDELSAGGHLQPLLTQTWRWSVDLTTDEVARLFGTFSNWREDEVRAVAAAADDCGVVVTERYRSVQHLLPRT